MSISTVTFLADFMLRGYGIDDRATAMLDTFDIIIAPILNIDGYAFTWSNDRMWRKTRMPNEGSPCVGTGWCW